MVSQRNGGRRFGGAQATVCGRVDEQRDRFLGDRGVGKVELDDVSNGVGVEGVAGVEGGRGGLEFSIYLRRDLVGASEAEAPFSFVRLISRLKPRPTVLACSMRR